VTETRFWNVAGKDAGGQEHGRSRRVRLWTMTCGRLAYAACVRVRPSPHPDDCHSCCWGLLAVTGVVREPVA
jgi:hypothetical protein